MSETSALSAEGLDWVKHHRAKLLDKLRLPDPFNADDHLISFLKSPNATESFLASFASAATTLDAPASITAPISKALSNAKATPGKEGVSDGEAKKWIGLLKEAHAYKSSEAQAAFIHGAFNGHGGGTIAKPDFSWTHCGGCGLLGFGLGGAVGGIAFCVICGLGV